ncbi:DUF4870 domain-containing protein [Chitinolyticbacter albus]|uniref:DUF4870 domain-containing protein n=1 Tax=Chitinolyticbacter albus TaxID=2961951 RepID=UPI00210A06D7|nr:DUF4870 domain-containing protein [Chitinolyticbacter albus]
MLTLNPKPAGDDDDGKPRPPSQAEKGFAVLAHLAGLCWFPLMPMQPLALLIPFLTLQFARVHSEFVEQHAVQASNFQLLMGCFYVVAMIISGVTHSAIPLWWVAIGSTLFALWEAAKAINGWRSKYPVTLKLFK